MKFQNPSIHRSKVNRRTHPPIHPPTDKPKAICPSNLIKVGGIKNELAELRKSKTNKRTVVKLKNEIKLKTTEVKCLKLRISNKNKILKRIGLQNNRRAANILRLKEQNEALKNSIENLYTEIQRQGQGLIDLNNNSEQLKHELNDKIAENNWLADIVTADSENITFFDNNEGKYSYELRQCIYDLLSLNVSASNCSNVIRSVLKLVNKKVEKLPSSTTILNMNVERLILAQEQVNEILPEENNLTIYTDETSKYGNKYSGYHVSDSKGEMYVLGMRQILTKSRQDNLSAFEEILQDINERSSEADDTAKRILLNITATMSDRASTEHKFNSLLESLRAEVLPELNENWNNLSNEDQTSASQLLNFFGGLHSLVHFAESANISVAKVEKKIFEGNVPTFDASYLKAKESGTARLVRTACKVFSRGGDEKDGRHKEFCIFVSDYLRQNKLHSLPLQPFHGNRFNILFESSAAIFACINKCVSFWREIHPIIC